jgi:hypothetical protein
MDAHVLLGGKSVRQFPTFFAHPVTDEDCLLVLYAKGQHEMPARLAAVASTWKLLDLVCGQERIFTYEFGGRLWAASIAAESGEDAETQLTALAHSVWSRGMI